MRGSDKRGEMYAEERQLAVAELVARAGRVSVTELAANFDVTAETVRRDLSLLEGRGLVRRVHGGALPVESATLLEARLTERDLANIEQKQRIAQAAVAFLPGSGGTVLLDAGTTTARLAQILPPDRAFTVITHAVPIAERLADDSKIELHLLPGRVRRKTHAAVGVATVTALSRVRADVAFVGANGITLDHGLSTPDHAEAATKAALISAAQRTIVLCDSSKIGVERTVSFARLDDIDVLITDAGISAAQREAFARVDLELVIV